MCCKSCDALRAKEVVLEEERERVAEENEMREAGKSEAFIRRAIEQKDEENRLRKNPLSVEQKDKIISQWTRTYNINRTRWRRLQTTKSCVVSGHLLPFSDTRWKDVRQYNTSKIHPKRLLYVSNSQWITDVRRERTPADPNIGERVDRPFPLKLDGLLLCVHRTITAHQTY